MSRCSPGSPRGYSIYIYHIAPDEANDLRMRLGLPLLRRDD